MATLESNKQVFLQYVEAFNRLANPMNWWRWSIPLRVSPTLHDNSDILGKVIQSRYVLHAN
jgi:hypothetical protein